MQDFSHLENLERQIQARSVEERLWLLERLAQGLRHSKVSRQVASLDDLSRMAADPDIQRELREIEREYSVAEQDGLEDS